MLQCPLSTAPDSLFTRALKSFFGPLRGSVRTSRGVGILRSKQGSPFSSLPTPLTQRLLHQLAQHDRPMQAKMEEAFESDKKRSVQGWDRDEKEEVTSHADDHNESEESVSTSGWKGKGRERVSFLFRCRSNVQLS